jgi:hypothetical protein
MCRFLEAIREIERSYAELGPQPICATSRRYPAPASALREG